MDFVRGFSCLGQTNEKFNTDTNYYKTIPFNYSALKAFKNDRRDTFGKFVTAPFVFTTLAAYEVGKNAIILIHNLSVIVANAAIRGAKRGYELLRAKPLQELPEPLLLVADPMEMESLIPSDEPVPTVVKEEKASSSRSSRFSKLVGATAFVGLLGLGFYASQNEMTFPVFQTQNATFTPAENSTSGYDRQTLLAGCNNGTLTAECDSLNLTPAECGVYSNLAQYCPRVTG